MIRRKLMASVGIILIVCVLLVAAPQRTKGARFVMASWNYPDQYGQGIEGIKLYENVSGSWESLTGAFYYDPDESSMDVFELNNSAKGIRLNVRCWLNNTLVGAADIDDARNCLRHNVTLYLEDTVVFFQQNFTYESGTDSLDPMFMYLYYIEVPHNFVGGLTYLAVVYYDIYY